jgi:putative transposase
LKRLQRQFAKAKKRSHRWYKLLRAIQKTHFRVKCQRQDFLHKTVNALLEQTDCLIHEDLHIANMLRRPTPKQDATGTYLPNGACHVKGLHLSISDAAWGTFLNLVAYKVNEQGKRRIPTNPRGSSQECVCGHPVKKTLSQRVHACPNCGLVENRDFVSSQVLLRRGLATLAESAA